MRNLFFLSVLFMAFGCGKSNYATYQPVYARVNWEEQPDYSQLKNWAAHPQKIDPWHVKNTRFLCPKRFANP